MSLITYRSRVHFADRVLEDALPVEIARNGIRRPLVLSGTDTPGDGVERLLDALPVTLAATPFATDPDRPAEEERLHALARLAEARCDGIVALGGSRPIDLARVLGGGGLPVLAVPTGTDTIGLGPLGRDFAGRRGARAALPAAILCDPTLTTETGPAETAASGMSLLSHCLESFLSTAFNPPADGMALDGLRRAMQALEPAVRDGADLDARRDLLAAALNAGLAAEKGWGGIEAAAQGLEAASHRRQGLFHGALLSGVLAFNAPAIASRFAAIRTALGLPAGAEIPDSLTALARRVGLPMRLSEAGIDAPLLPLAARRAAAAPSNRTNPRHATARDYEGILRASL